MLSNQASVKPVCPLCAAERQRRLYRLQDLQILYCPGCHLVFLSYKPTLGELRQMYGPRYFEERRGYFFENDIVTPPTSVHNGSLHEFRDILQLLSRFGVKGRLLDVGCANGVFLALAREAGWYPYGVDISSYAAEFARERLALRNVSAGTVAEAHHPEGFFDVVTLLDVFEHLPDPLSELHEIRRILKTGGLLLINTPNEQSLLRRIARFLYRCSMGTFTYPVQKLYHPYHLCSYSQNCLEKVLKDCGFTITYVTKKPLLGPKGRVSPVVRQCLQTFAGLERLLGMEYELLVAAQKLA